MAGSASEFLVIKSCCQGHGWAHPVKNYSNNVKLNHKDAEGGYYRAEEINCL